MKNNIPIHTEVIFNSFLDYSNFNRDFLPPYSPMLTSVEEAISHIKGNIREQMNNSQRLNLSRLVTVGRGLKKKSEIIFLINIIANEIINSNFNGCLYFSCFTIL